MKIVAVATRPYRVGSRSGLLLRLTDETGRVGQGEAAPLPGYSPDSAEDAARDLERVGRAELPGIDVEASLEEQLTHFIGSLQICSPAARFAVETALLDLAGQHLDLPVAALLGASRSTLPISTLVTDWPGPQWVESGKRALERGITVVKFKIGYAFDSEHRALEEVARALGGVARLRLDANQRYNRSEAAVRLASLAPLRPELVEEPISGGIDRNLESFPVPIAADETLQRPQSAEGALDAISRGRLRALVLKPMALGGIYACLALARRAVALGGAALVTHMHDGPVAHAATSALGLSLPGPTLHAGLDHHPVLDHWPETHLAWPWLSENAVLRSDRPGLGLEQLDPR
jgi:L-alanine-DL-glutamate epimerase-like enolase superfamily enzyme